MAVAVAPNMGCGVCDMCVSGNTQMCATFKAFGINIPGGFAQYMKVPREAVSQGNLAPIPDGRGLRVRRARGAAGLRLQRLPADRHRPG